MALDSECDMATAASSSSKEKSYELPHRQLVATSNACIPSQDPLPALLGGLDVDHCAGSRHHEDQGGENDTTMMERPLQGLSRVRIPLRLAHRSAECNCPARAQILRVARGSVPASLSAFQQMWSPRMWPQEHDEAAPPVSAGSASEP
ncbi:actin-6-like [Pteropus vampyrus]|uniref:Actin-6-like n=1 Tax=Pteropus vampyrus TaxID=132908 RepID=A0A6P3QW67_PTEVA|nr:actin-6-like [Pteropus vampyrus]